MSWNARFAAPTLPCITASELSAPLLDGSSPIRVRGYWPGASLAFEQLDENQQVNLAESPETAAPTHLDNNSLVQPLTTEVPIGEALRQLSSGKRRMGLHKVTLPSRVADQLAAPLAHMQQLVGQPIERALLWLNNGQLNTNLHFDPRDNLQFQLSGKKEVLLLPPAIMAELGYLSPREEMRYAARNETAAADWIKVATNRPAAENHSPLPVFASFASRTTAIADSIVDQARICTLHEGDALFIPALWSHAVLSHPATRHPPINAMVNWCVRSRRTSATSCARLCMPIFTSCLHARAGGI